MCNLNKVCQRSNYFLYCNSWFCCDVILLHICVLTGVKQPTVRSRSNRWSFCFYSECWCKCYYIFLLLLPPYHSGTCFRFLSITIGITSFLPCKENFAVWLPQMSLSSLSNSINALELVLHHWHCKCTLFIWINLGFGETAHLPLP